MKFTFFLVICVTEKTKERSRGFEKSFIRATIFVVYQLVNKPLISHKRGGGGEFEQLAMQKAGRLLTPPSLRQLELCSPNWPGRHSVDQILQKKSECGDAQLQSPHWWGGGRADWSSRPVYPSRVPGDRGKGKPLCKSGWPRSQRDSPATASQMLALKACKSYLFLHFKGKSRTPNVCLHKNSTKRTEHESSSLGHCRSRNRLLGSFTLWTLLFLTDMTAMLTKAKS